MDITEKIIEAIGNDIWQKAVVSTDMLTFDKEIREACERNYCGCYGKSWTCPPGVGEIDELREKLMKYSSAFIFTTKHSLEDSFDFEGMQTAHKVHDEVTDRLRDICSEYGALLLGAGSCRICGKCTYPDSPCRFPDKALTSLEACGVNVMALSKAAGINYINGANTVTYFTAVLFN